MSIILDARSGDSNAPSTGLGFRHVLGHVDPATGGREYREALSEGDYLWLSKSDGDIGRVGLEYRAEEIVEALGGGVFRYAFREEVEVLESSSAGVAVSLSQEGLSFLSSVSLDVLRVRVLSPTFYWTSNEGRDRFIFEGRTWRLKRGGGVLDMGEFGEDMVLGGGGVVRIGLVYGSALSAYELGGVELPCLRATIEMAVLYLAVREWDGIRAKTELQTILNFRKLGFKLKMVPTTNFLAQVAEQFIITENIITVMMRLTETLFKDTIPSPVAKEAPTITMNVQRHRNREEIIQEEEEEGVARCISMIPVLFTELLLRVQMVVAVLWLLDTNTCPWYREYLRHLQYILVIQKQPYLGTHHPTTEALI